MFPFRFQAAAKVAARKGRSIDLHQDEAARRSVRRNTVAVSAGRKVTVTMAVPSRPNSTMAPTPRYSSVPSPGISTSGASPHTVVMVVMAMGRSRERTASLTDSATAMPPRRLVSASCTIRIGLLTTVPIRIKKPSMEIMSNGWLNPGRPSNGISSPRPFNSARPRMPLAMPTGMVVMISSG